MGINAWFPGTLGNPAAFVLVGMGSFFAAAANVPVSSTILIKEMSKSYGLMAPPTFLRMNDPLGKAYNYFLETGEPELLVKHHGSSNRFIGMVSERDFLLAYEQAMTG